MLTQATRKNYINIMRDIFYIMAVSSKYVQDLYFAFSLLMIDYFNEYHGELKTRVKTIRKLKQLDRIGLGQNERVMEEKISNFNHRNYYDYIIINNDRAN